MRETPKALSTDLALEDILYRDYSKIGHNLRDNTTMDNPQEKRSFIERLVLSNTDLSPLLQSRTSGAILSRDLLSAQEQRAPQRLDVGKETYNCIQYKKQELYNTSKV